MNWDLIYSWIDHISTILSLPAAGLGFWVAMRQINKTKDAAESAKATIDSARADASRSSVLVLVPQLQRIEDQLDKAIEVESTQLTLAWANTWRWQAGQLKEHLKSLESPDRQLIQLLQASIVAAANAKESLVGIGNSPEKVPDIRRATKRLRTSILAVTSELGGVVVSFAKLPDEKENDQ